MSSDGGKGQPGGVGSDAYRAAGVDIDLAHDLLGRVKAKIGRTSRPEVLAPIGGFGGLFQIDLKRFSDPVMVTSIDSVGTKVLVALMMDEHRSVGHDIVNHCINDIAVQGAEPVYFLDYIGIGRLRSPLYEHVLEGLADACKAQGVALIGGETAEMAGMYGEDYDLVGCITGIVDRNRIITGSRIEAGHVAVGLAANGLHTNGYSLARHVLFEQAGLTVHSAPDELLGETVGQALLKPHTCYWPAIKEALSRELPLHGMAHITGGGLFDNVPRILPEDVAVTFDANALPVPPIFRLIRELGQVDSDEMYRVFNMGIGMVWFVPASVADEAVSVCQDAGIGAAVCGQVTPGDRDVTVIH